MLLYPDASTHRTNLVQRSEYSMFDLVTRDEDGSIGERSCSIDSEAMTHSAACSDPGMRDVQRRRFLHVESPLRSFVVLNTT